MANTNTHERLSDRSFGLLFAGILLGITALGWLVSQHEWRILGAVGLTLLLLALVAPGILMPLNRLWDAFAQRLAPVTNTILLGTFFYLVLAPVGLARRLFASDPLERKPRPDATSYWTPVERQVTTETLKDLF
jgi:hypothetical protein